SAQGPSPSTDTTSGVAQGPSPGTDTTTSGIGQDHSAPSVDYTSDDAYFDLDPAVYYEQENNSCGFIPSLTTEPFSDNTNSCTIEDDSPSDEVLEGLFLQQYVKVIGPWLDAFDVGKFFSQVVPLEALGSPLLRTSISAVAAKQLGNLQALDSVDIDTCQRRILAEYARLCPLDMLFQAARFYDKAIRHILHMLQSLNSPHQRLNHHIIGSYQLLQIGTEPEHILSDVDSERLERAREATFWNLVFFDITNSFVTGSQMTLRISNSTNLWTQFGLSMLQRAGPCYPSCLGEESSRPKMDEKTSCQAALWLCSRVVNDIATRGTVGAAFATYGVEDDSIAHWAETGNLLRTWRARIPDSFTPYLRVRSTAGAQSSTDGLSAVFYASPLAASTLVLHHFTWLLVYLQGPPPQDRLRIGTARLQAYRDISRQVEHHVEEIAGIAAGEPQPSVKVQLLHPLYLAGCCVDTHEMKSALINLMTNIQRCTGYPVQWRTEELQGHCATTGNGETSTHGSRPGCTSTSGST
ncbi:unnamed protein product, partial [Clonostachys solani]